MGQVVGAEDRSRLREVLISGPNLTGDEKVQAGPDDDEGREGEQGERGHQAPNPPGG